MRFRGVRLDEQTEQKSVPFSVSRKKKKTSYSNSRALFSYGKRRLKTACETL